MGMTREQQIRAFIHNRRSEAERRRQKSINPAVPGNQPRTQRELNIVMVAEETAKLAILSDLEGLLNQLEASNGNR
ncbi:MAG: hypothetical protein ACRCT2_02855 [Plesiomonas shigelloides]